MRNKWHILASFLIVIFCSAKSAKEVFTLTKFEETLSKISDEFYMSKYEVSNLQYMTFLTDVKSSGNEDKYQTATIDSLNWRDKYAFNEPYVVLYHNHPAYNQYPVVNITYEAAVLYCDWLTEKYNSYQKRKFKKVKFRLPSKEEWETAARGGLQHSTYPWGGYYLNDYKGRIMCNYLRIGDESIHFNYETKSLQVIDHSGDPEKISATSSITEPVNSYFPNGYSMYNICGNVAEMISEKGIAKGGSYASPGYDVRIVSSEKFEKSSNHIGFRVCMDVLEKWK